MKKLILSLTAVFFLFNLFAQDTNLKRLTEQQINERKEALNKVKERLENSRQGEPGQLIPLYPRTSTQEQPQNQTFADEKQDDAVTAPAKHEISEKELEKSSRKYSEKLRKQIQEMIAERNASPAERSKATPPQRPTANMQERPSEIIPSSAPDSASVRKDIPESGWKGRRISKGETKTAGEVIKKVPAQKREIQTTKTSEEELKLRKDELLAKYSKRLTPEEHKKQLIERSKKSAEAYATKQNFGEIMLLAANEADSNALVAIRNALSGLENYWPADQPIANWPGVFLNENGRVERINIYNFGVSGAFPDETGNLSELRELDFGENFGITALPSTIANLTELERLSAFNNEISSLPDGFETLKNLTFLDLSGNNLEGPMPEQIFGLDSLETLYFWWSNLTQIGESFGNLKYLRLVELDGNQLESLPASIQNLDSIRHFGLSNNRLKRFPDEIAGMESLEYLYMWSNQIFDEIPSAYFSDLKMLREFDFGDNRVFGALPATIAEADSLGAIRGHGNILNKPLPPEIGGMASIQEIDLSYNLIPGVIPAEIGNDTTLLYLLLYNNKLEGEIPAELGNLTNLFYLDFENCNLSGTIPESLGNLTNLHELWINSNNFSGAIPDALGTGLNNLRNLYIQHNQFTGLPTDVSGLNNFWYLEAHNNHLEFDDFEPFVQLFPGFYINPQNPSETQILNPAAGATVELDPSVGGNRNIYDWFKNGEYLGSFEGSGIITIDNFSLEDAGYYSAWIYSDSVYDLSLYREFELYYSETVAEQDSLALVALYEATNPHGEPSWERDEHWLESPVAMWEGVSIQDGRVVGLHLDFNNLQGGIPPEIENLTELRYLSLFGNNIRYLASEFYNLTNLTYLDLDANQLRGDISPLIGNLTNLDTLWLGRNGWEGEVPEELYSLTKLRTLGLYYGGHTGEISPLIGNLVNLRYLNLGGNYFSGSLPAELGNLTELEYLALYQLPKMDPGLSALSTLSNLRVLDIGGSSLLNGEIPAFIGNMSDLISFYAGGSDLSAGMESLLFLTTLSNLKYLDLSHSGLSGEFTHNLDLMDSLQILWMGGNEITGFSAQVLTNPNIRELFIWDNMLTELPPLDMPKLELLVVPDNELTSLPDLSNLEMLVQIDAAHNKLTFDDLIPFEYFYTSGRTFWVSPQAPLNDDASLILPAGSNHQLTVETGDTSSHSITDWYIEPFHGDESFYIFSGETLNIENASNPGHDGVYYAEVYNELVTPYTGLWLDGGRTEIQVVESIAESDSLALVAIFEAFGGSLWDDKEGWLEEPVETWAGVDAYGGRVRGLYLYGMYGEIPAEVADLDSLEYLQIVDGNLVGEIPAEIFNLERLQHFDVGGNRLTGTIPETVGNAANLETFGIRGNEITGTIPQSMGGLSNLRNFWADGYPFQSTYLEGAIPAGWAANEWESFYVQYNRFDELPVGLDTAFRFVNGDLSYNDFDMGDLVRGVGTAPYFSGGYIYLYGQQNFRRALTVHGEIASDAEVVLSAERAHPDDQFNWYFEPNGDGYFEHITTTQTDSFLVIPNWEDFRNVRILAGVTNPNLGIYYEEYSNTITLNTHERRYASGGVFSPEGGQFNLVTPISSVTGPPDNYPWWDWQLRNWWHNQSQPDFDTLTLFFDNPIPVNYFRHHGNEINLQSIAFRGDGQEVVYQVNRTFFDNRGYRINRFPRTTFPVSEVELILSNGSMDAFEIGDDGSEVLVKAPFIDADLSYTSGQQYDFASNGYIGIAIRSEADYINGVAETYIERSTEPEAGFVVIDTFHYLNSWYTDYNLPEPGATYYYRVRMRIGDEVSAYSNVVKQCNTITNIPGLAHPDDNRSVYSYWKVTSEGTGDFAGYTGKRDTVIFVNDYYGENYFGIQGPYHGGFFDQFSKNEGWEGLTYFADNCGSLQMFFDFSSDEFPADSLWGTYENDTLFLHWRDAMNGIEGLSKFVYIGPVDEEEEEGDLHKPGSPHRFEAYVFSSDSIRMSWDWGFDGGEFPEEFKQRNAQRYYQEFDEPEFFIIQEAIGKTGAFADFETVGVEAFRDRRHYLIPNAGDGETYRYRIIAGNEAGLSYPSEERAVIHKTPFFDPAFTIVSFDERRTSYGGAFGDIDNDGDQDLYIANAFENANNFLYENLGDGQFEKLTTPIAVRERAFSRSASFGDYDNDGFVDLFVPGGASGMTTNTPDRIYRNTGAKSFEVTNANLISNFSSGEAGVWVDLDNDGYLDLVTTRGMVFRNTTEGQFEAFDTLRGFDGNDYLTNYGFIVMTLRSLDYDSDGDQDIYATSDSFGNRLYVNDGNGKLALETGLSISDGGLGSRGATWFDADNDSDLDLFISDGNNPGLYVNEGEEFTHYFIGEIIDQPVDDVVFARGVTTGDFDNNGLMDIVLIVEGRPYIILNQGNLSFHVVMDDEQFFPEMLSSSHVSTGDIDNDGFLDLLFLAGDASNQSPNFLFRNNANENAWLNLRLKGINSNASGIGAKVFVTANGQTQFKDVTSQNGLGSGNSLSLDFGLGSAGTISSLRVEWPSGDVTELTDVSVNQRLTLSERVPVDPADSAALVALYDALGGESWTDNTGWLEGSPLEWYGVSFNADRRVSSIVLSNNNLTGTIPGDITSLTALEVLDLSGNNLVKGLPTSIGNLTSLKSLSLNDNDLDGSIPASITGLANLENIDLYNNQMKGELPVNIGDLASLKQFEIQNNEFIGFLPASFGSLNSLEVLNISNNMFEGEIPAGLGGAANLQILNIGNNGFAGSFPSALGDLSALVEFRADSNEFTGILPAEFAAWTGIQVVDVSSNALTGSLEPLAAYDSVSLINVSHNKFTDLSDFSGSSADSVIARYNHLDFGDFENSLTLIESGFIRINPQDSLFDRIDSLHNVGEPVNIFYSVEGAFNSYQWYKDGEVLENQTALAIEIQSPEKEHEGEYVLEVTNELFPDITLYTSIFNLKLSSLERDRQALIALYNATGGSQWTNKAGWDSNAEDLSTWHGVTVQDDRVTRLELPNNNMEGRVPRSFVDLNGLTHIDLSGNSLRSFWDISRFEFLESVDISDNRLAFQDIVPNVELGDVITYAPQKRYDVTLNDTIQAGRDYNVSINMAGSGLEYQWHFGPLLPGQPFNNDVSPIENANSRQYLVEDIDYDKQGTYRVDITHPQVPGLTITSRNRNLWASTDLFGTVYADDNQTPLSDGEVIIYRIKEGPYIGEDTAAVGVNGAYVFEDLVLGDFIVLVKPVPMENPQPGDIVPVQTYYEKTEFDSAASALQVRERLEGIDIQMVNYEVPEEEPLGASITGTVESNFEEDEIVDEEGNRIEARRKVKKAGCSMRRRTRGGGGRTGQEEDEYELYAYVETDDEGIFDFTGIPEGEYLLNIQYPGIPMDETSDIKFVIGGDVQEQKFSAAAIITEAGISIDAYEVLSVPKPYLKDVQLYPNPTEAILSVDFVVNRRIDDLKIVVLTVEGVTLFEHDLDHTMGLHSSQVDLSRYNSGFYFLVFTDEAGSFRHQIKIGKK